MQIECGQDSLFQDEAGTAFLELALVLPLLLLLLVGGFEYSRLIRIRQATTSFTHSLSKTIERSCRTEIDAHRLNDPSSNNTALLACISQYSGSATLSFGSESFTVDVLSSVYKWDASTFSAVDVASSNGPPFCPVMLTPSFSINCSSEPSRLTSSGVTSTYGVALASTGDMVFVESSVRVTPILGKILHFFGFGFPLLYSVGVS